MAKSQYNLIWKEGSFFEKGHWRLVPKGDANGGAIGWIITIGLVGFIAFCLILTLPLWISLLGFSMVKSKRHFAGIGSIIALLYFILDVQKKWISGFLFYGYNSSSGSFNEGIFGEKYAIYFYVINGIGVVIGLSFILESYLSNQENNSNYSYGEYNDHLSTKQLPRDELKINNDIRNSYKMFAVIFGAIILVIGGALYFKSQNESKKEIEGKTQVVQDTIDLDKKNALLIDENNKLKEKAYQDSISLANQQEDSFSNTDSINSFNSSIASNINVSENTETLKKPIDIKEITSTYFYGTWKFGDSNITFLESGNCFIKDLPLRYSWSYNNGYLLIVEFNNAAPFQKEKIITIYEDSFTYKDVEENILRKVTKIE